MDGYVVGPVSATDTAITLFDGTTGKLVKSSGITVDGSDNITNAGTFNGVTVEEAHAARHENGGADEISIAGLSGEAADAQKVAVSLNSGATVGTRSTLNFIEGIGISLTIADDAGGNEVDITIDSSIDLDGYVVGPASATDEAIARFNLTSGKLIQNSNITIDDTGNLSILSNNELRFRDNGNYVGFEAPALDADQIWVLPAADGNDGYVLTTDGLGNLTFAPVTGPGLGDVTGPASSTDNAIARFNGTSGKVIQNSSILIDDTGNLQIRGGDELRFYDVGNSNYVGFEAPALTGDQIWVLPSADGDDGYALTTNGTGTLSWSPAGDVSGPASSTDNTLVRFDGTSGKLIQGSAIVIDDSDNIFMDGYLDMSNEDIDNIKTATFNSVPAGSGSGGTIDWSSAQKRKFTMTGAGTLTFTAPAGPCNLMLLLVNAGTNAPTWPATVLWPGGGTEPSWTTTGTDVVAFFYDGTNYYAVGSLDFQ